MFSDAADAFSDIFTPPFRGVLFKSIIFAVLLLAVIWIGFQSLVGDFAGALAGWLATILILFSGAGGLVLLGFFLAPITTLFAGLFLDDAAEAVERTHFPQDGVGEALPLDVALWTAFRFTLLVIAVNFVALLLVLIPGINFTIFIFANGYLLGREYFHLAARRFHDEKQVIMMRKARGGRIFVAGLLSALFLSVPILNLATPLFATALMVRVHKRIEQEFLSEL